MSYSSLLLAIVSANPGIIIQHTEIKEIVREVFNDTGVIIGSKPVLDWYDHPYQTDYDGEPRQMFRSNKRKFALTIKEI